MKNRKIATICIIIASFLLTAGIVKAASLTVDSLKVGKQGVGGVTFFNGTIINNTTGSGGADNPVTFGDNVRIDGRVYRGVTAGAGLSDNKPFSINDDLEVVGNLNAKGNIFNNSTNSSGGDNPVTFADNVKINNNLTVDNNLIVSGDLTFNGITPLKRKIYTGTIDVTQDGDVVKTDEEAECEFSDSTKYYHYHYKKISVPEVDLNNMPEIMVFDKPSSIFPSDLLPDNVWGYHVYATFSQGYVYVFYKEINELCDGSIITTSLVTDYKIVVSY